jgi:hypothetical protein
MGCRIAQYCLQQGDPFQETGKKQASKPEGKQHGADLA